MSENELQLFIYQCQNGSNVELKSFDGNTLWATQKQIAVLFDCDVRTVNYHIQEIIKTGELQQNSVIQNFRITAYDGKN